MSIAAPLREPLRQALAGMPLVRMALLFGSHARGTAGPDSDIDVAVQAPASEGPAIAAALSAACGQEVDVVILDDPPIPLLDALVRDGEIIFEAERGAGARWRSSALLTLETDRPWFERMSRAWLARVAGEGLPWSTAPLIATKLTELADRIGRVRQHRTSTSANLAAQRDAFDLVAFNLTLAVQICADIASDLISDEGWPAAKTVGEAFTRLQEHQVISPAIAAALRNAVGLRNLVAHGYAGVDPALLHLAATQGVDDLDAFARAIAAWSLK